MLSLILASLGAVLGVSGLLLGALAFRRTHKISEGCDEAIRRLLPDDDGVDVRALRDIAIVRYNALEEMSGAMSFSLAMLNAAGDGVVLTSINGRAEARTYAKIVEGGNTAETISPEEYRAIRSARMGHRPGLTIERRADPAPLPVTPATSGSGRHREAPASSDGESENVRLRRDA